MPITSTWMKHRSKAEPFTVDLKGVDKLVLVTSGGPDGSSYDHAVWANARLIKPNGTSVWLDSISYEYSVTGWGNPKLNKNIYDNDIIIAGKKYEHGVLCHADGILIYPLQEQYVRFEAEVGIDDASVNGSAYFSAMNIAPNLVIKELVNQYPHEMAMLSMAV